MRGTTALFSSARDDWETPPELFAALDAEFGFALDAAANARNAKCERFLSPNDDALSRPWTPGPVWLNPPYGRRMMIPWMRHAAEQSQRGETVVCLVPARTDVEWFQEWVFPYADELRFLRGRVNFVGGESGSTFPSVVVIYRGRRPGAAPRLTTMVQSWKRGRRRTR